MKLLDLLFILQLELFLPKVKANVSESPSQPAVV